MPDDPYPPFAVHTWTMSGSVDRELFRGGDLKAARQAFDRAVAEHADRTVTLRQESRVLASYSPPPAE